MKVPTKDLIEKLSSRELHLRYERGEHVSWELLRWCYDNSLLSEQLHINVIFLKSDLPGTVCGYDTVIPLKVSVPGTVTQINIWKNKDYEHVFQFKTKEFKVQLHKEDLGKVYIIDSVSKNGTHQPSMKRGLVLFGSLIQESVKYDSEL